MFKKFAIAAPLAVLALNSSMAFAAGEANHSIDLKAHVPSKNFYVVPTNPDLVNKTQSMDYNPGTGELNDVDGSFEILHTAGHVESSLTTMPVLYSGGDQIPVEVKLNNTVLGLTPTLVVGDAESNTNFRAMFKIKSLVKGADAKPGDYTGTVSMTHDAVLR